MKENIGVEVQESRLNSTSNGRDGMVRNKPGRVQDIVEYPTLLRGKASTVRE